MNFEEFRFPRKLLKMVDHFRLLVISPKNQWLEIVVRGTFKNATLALKSQELVLLIIELILRLSGADDATPHWWRIRNFCALKVHNSKVCLSADISLNHAFTFLGLSEHS